MSEQPVEPTVAATEPVEPTPTPEAPKPTETVDFWKQKAREQEARAKANATAAQRLAEIEESQKSEAQKQADRIAAAERQAAEAAAESLRYRAAARHGIDEEHFDLLGTGTQEDIDARATRLGSLLALKGENERLTAELEALRAGKPTPTGARPIEALRPGSLPVEHQSEDDVAYAKLFKE